MSQARPPVLGFNNNVRHRGRVFHIQTEDSGVKSPRIVTHLFADGGRIMKTLRTSYAELLERADSPQLVRQIMKEQHQAMFAALRAGELDALLETACGPLPLPRSEPRAQRPEAARAPSSATLPARSNAIEPSRTAAPAPAERPASSQSLPAVKWPSQAPEARASVAPVPRKSRAPSSPSIPARPASRYGSAPIKSARSIFGDASISEQSLDEVILSYLAEDLDGSE